MALTSPHYLSAHRSMLREPDNLGFTFDHGVCDERADLRVPLARDAPRPLKPQGQNAVLRFTRNCR